VRPRQPASLGILSQRVDEAGAQRTARLRTVRHERIEKTRRAEGRGLASRPAQHAKSHSHIQQQHLLANGDSRRFRATRLEPYDA